MFTLQGVKVRQKTIGYFSLQIYVTINLIYYLLGAKNQIKIR